MGTENITENITPAADDLRGDIMKAFASEAEGQEDAQPDVLSPLSPPQPGAGPEASAQAPPRARDAQGRFISGQVDQAVERAQTGPSAAQLPGQEVREPVRAGP